MRISVIVPTYRRTQSLSRCLDALDAQLRPADETIVVARGEDSASRAAVASRPRAPRLVRVERPGVVAAMNAGIDACDGDVVALTDDDAAPHADWLQRIERVYAAEADVADVAAVGGRDWVYKQGRLWDGAERTVGTINWFGRVTGNHHLGVGPARDVDVLKGANLSVRGELLREVRIDERLIGVGTEHHWELALCLTLRRRGLRVVYDPAIAVDHHPQPRVEDSRRFSRQERRDATHNEALAILEHLPAWRRPAYVAWACAVGTRATPGIAQLLRLAPSQGTGAWNLFRGTQTGLWLGLRARLRSPRRGSGH